jgi:hypothetical protein
VVYLPLNKILALQKNKIFNDPIYGFITFPSPLIEALVAHPVFQRLRRISQMGLSYLVFPGAHHTRFSHALGCLHIMQRAVDVLKSKNVAITSSEEQALYIAILLHDIGHGPFSHAMEHSLVDGIGHEQISLRLMEKLNVEFNGELELAIRIFKGDYHKKFLLQLVSSQLDMDRMDYLNRDSFFSGVAEGQINSDRLLQMLHVVHDQLVVEEKGIYSVEKFLMARRLMYWEAYLHKTSLSAELMLIKTLQRAKELSSKGIDVASNGALAVFLNNKINASNFSDATLDYFSQLDDYDIISALKLWQHNSDRVLAELSTRILNRDILKIKISSQKHTKAEVGLLQKKFMKVNKCNAEIASFFIFQGKIKNEAYSKNLEPIRILKKDGMVEDVTTASDQMHIKALAKPVVKYYLCFPKHLAES